MRAKRTVEEPITTVKIHAVSQMNEKEYAQYCYDQAMQKMLDKPTPQNIAEFEKANKHLYEVQDAYRIGTRLLLERVNRVTTAVKSLFTL